MGFDRTDFYDAELRRHDERFRAALKVGPRDRMLDRSPNEAWKTRSDPAQLTLPNYLTIVR